jgi:hypothetical protein
VSVVNQANWDKNIKIFSEIFPQKQNFWAETRGMKYIVESLGSRLGQWQLP